MEATFNSNKHYRKKRVRNRIAFLICVSPALVWFFSLMVWPMINMFILSTKRWDGIISPKTAIGLRNYQRMLTDPHFGHAIANTGIHVGVGLLLTIPPAMILGYFLTQRYAGYRILRTVFFMPSMISVAALAMIFLGIYMPDGILNHVLSWLGLGSLQQFWLASPNTALGAVIAVDVWGGIGYYSVLFFAAFVTIPSDMYEAARLEGSGPWTSLWKIAVPQIVDFIGVVVTLHFLWLFLGSAQNVLLLTHGGPGDKSLTIGYYMFTQAFTSQRLGYSQAIAVVAFVIGIAVMILIRRMTRRDHSM